MIKHNHLSAELWVPAYPVTAGGCFLTPLPSNTKQSPPDTLLIDKIKDRYKRDRILKHAKYKIYKVKNMDMETENRRKVDERPSPPPPS